MFSYSPSKCNEISVFMNADLIPRVMPKQYFLPDSSTRRVFIGEPQQIKQSQ